MKNYLIALAVCFIGFAVSAVMHLNSVGKLFAVAFIVVLFMIFVRFVKKVTSKMKNVKVIAPTRATAKPNAEPTVAPVLKPVPERIHVAGTSFRQKEIKTFLDNDPANLNVEYDMSKSELIAEYPDSDQECIYRYDTYDTSFVDLVPEPENPHDPNAIKVMISDLGKTWTHVGYIKAGSISHIKKLQESGATFTAEIYGGNYKELMLDNDDIDYDRAPKASDFSLDKVEDDFKVILLVSKNKK